MVKVVIKKNIKPKKKVMKQKQKQIRRVYDPTGLTHSPLHP